MRISKLGNPAGGGISLSGTFLAITVAIAVACVLLMVTVSRLQTENATLRTERDLDDVAVRSAQSDLKARSVIAEHMINDLGRQLREKEDFSRLVFKILVPPAGEHAMAAVVVCDPAQHTAILAGHAFTPNESGSAYQLWTTNPGDAHATEVGSFQVGADGHASLKFSLAQPFDPALTFMVGVGQKGGELPGASGPWLLSSKW